ncbi:S-layer homology domain-containing protein [Nostoc sp. UHCC 0302]|uniref:S-layer homology domain-containing protein n=1 Tax=Nostoc sp. UHCC 0302 TaxID=3134896 RepID=UPI00311C94B9
MTNRPPSEPESSQRTALGFDEFIAILIAFATIGAILFWSFSRKDSSWNLNGLLSTSPTPSVQPNQVLPSAAAKVEPNVVPNFNASPSPPPAAVVEPNTTSSPFDSTTPPVLGLPSVNVAPTQSSQAQSPVTSPGNVEPPIAASALPLVTPSAKKSTIPPPIAFNDVPNNFWSRRFIDVLSSRGILKGFPDYSFRPNQAVNRAEFAALLEKAFDQEVGKSATSYKDVPAKFWATPAISQALSAGFLKGYPNNTFKPQQKILRSQVLVALASGLNLKEPASPNQILNVYKDAKNIPQYATGKIAAATANGLVVNYPDPQVLAPNKEATRAEVAAMIHQALVHLGKLEEISSQNIVRSPRVSVRPTSPKKNPNSNFSSGNLVR